MTTTIPTPSTLTLHDAQEALAFVKANAPSAWRDHPIARLIIEAGHCENVLDEFNSEDWEDHEDAISDLLFQIDLLINW